MRIDGHAHLASGVEALHRLLATMDKLKFERAVVVGGGLVPPDRIAHGLSREETRQLRFDHLGMLAQCAKAQGRLLPFYFANPWAETAEYRSSGSAFYGLKLGPAIHGVPLSDDRTRSYIAIAVDLGHPVYTHCLDQDGFRVLDLITLAKEFPKVRFILGHGGIGQLDFQCVGAIRPFKNIYYETSGAFKAPVQHACRTLGCERVLFGSEFPLQSASAELTKIEDLELTPEDFALVMGGTIERLLKRKLC